MKRFSWHGFRARVRRTNPLPALAIITLLASAWTTAPRGRRGESSSASPSGQRPNVLLSADGLRVTTNMTWNESAELRPELEVAWESPREVALRTRRNKRRLPPGAFIAAMIQYGFISVTLPSPLGTRRLVAAESGREIPYLDGKRLAEITWLPAGYRFEGDSIPMLQPRPVEDPEGLDWSRTYVPTDPSPEGPLELVVTQMSGPVPAGWGSDAPVVAHAEVGGQPAVIRERTESGTGRVRQRAVCWSTPAFSYCVTSWLVHGTGHDVLFRDTLLRIAEGMREPAS
jgi:hypothetical protein